MRLHVWATCPGSIYSYSTSYPFGDGVTWYGSTDPDTLFYAGLDHDSETNTEHAWARQYSSTEAVWTIPDPYSGSYDPNNPQSFNRYAYVLNNPLMLVDPSGLELDGGGEGDGGGDSTDDDYQGQQVVCCTNGLFGDLADFLSAIGDGISTAASAVAGFLAGGSDPSLGGGPGFDGGLGGPGGGGPSGGGGQARTVNLKVGGIHVLGSYSPVMKQPLFNGGLLISLIAANCDACGWSQVFTRTGSDSNGPTKDDPDEMSPLYGDKGFGRNVFNDLPAMRTGQYGTFTGTAVVGLVKGTTFTTKGGVTYGFSVGRNGKVGISPQPRKATSREMRTALDVLGQSGRQWHWTVR